MIRLRAISEKRDQILRLAEYYSTGEVRIFGSVARGENTKTSDVYLLIKTKLGCSPFDLGGLLEDL